MDVGVINRALWDRVSIGGANECWPWKLGADKDGYGLFTFERSRYRAHRLACELVNGPVRDGEVVMHSCDNRLCCNPAHLSAATQAKNIADMRSKGRARGGRNIGERNGSARLTADAAQKIRGDTRVARLIAEDFDISPNTVWAIKAGRIWASLNG